MADDFVRSKCMYYTCDKYYEFLCSPILSAEEYEENLKKRFAANNIFYERITRYLKTGTHAPGLQFSEKRRVQRQAHQYYWDPASKCY